VSQDTKLSQLSGIPLGHLLARIYHLIADFRMILCEHFNVILDGQVAQPVTQRIILLRTTLLLELDFPLRQYSVA